MHNDDRARARIDAFAEALRALKERTPHSYATLATRLSISRSTLHRYCAGRAVPAQFDVVRRLARQAEAGREELAELHRLWALATEPAPKAEAGEAKTERVADEPSTQPGAEPSTGTGAEPSTGTGAEPAAETSAETSAETEPSAEAGPPRASAGVSSSEGDATGAGDGDRSPVVTRELETDQPDQPAALRRSSRRRMAAVGAAVGVIASVLVGTLLWQSSGPDEVTAADDRPLFAAECEGPLRGGQHDDCVTELQELLAKTGVTIGVDGIFGPETLRRVVVFQMRAGLEADGIVGDKTKEALYEKDVDMSTWGKKRVRQKIREVFTEEPDDAVKIANCQSLFDPLHMLPNTDGSRNWGVFQLSDARLRDLRGTPGKALDPEWNIKAAHRLWQDKRDFSHWPHCVAALEDVEENADGKKDEG